MKTPLIASLILANASLAFGHAVPEGMEKCAGIVRKGKNDCAANKHQCAGKAAKDNDPNEWLALPKGTCEKITKGRLVVEK